MLHVSTNVGHFRLPHGLKSTWSHEDHVSATALMTAKAARCTASVRAVMSRSIG